uniref:Uncharacterized protein n=1 Tax=Cucumis melo TaxID=3656 RepID=A0A9I9EHZ1_CUCME
MASEIEGLGQVNPRRNVKQSTPSSPQMLNPINGSSKGSGVQCSAITDSTKVGNGNLVVPVLHGDYTGAGNEVGDREWRGEKGSEENENEEGKGDHCEEMGKKTRRKELREAFLGELSKDLKKKKK